MSVIYSFISKYLLIAYYVSGNVLGMKDAVIYMTGNSFIYAELIFHKI